MATPKRGFQDISTEMSIKFDGTVNAVDTWIWRPNTLVNRKWVIIKNQGVNNGMTSGMLYVSVLTAGTESRAITDPNIDVLSPGDSLEQEYSSDLIISVQGDTADICCRIQELDNPHHYSTQDS